MNVERLEGTILKIRKWEAELWSYISSGDGMGCPLKGRSQIRIRHAGGQVR